MRSVNDLETENTQRNSRSSEVGGGAHSRGAGLVSTRGGLGADGARSWGSR